MTAYKTADLKLEIDGHEKRIDNLEKGESLQNSRLENLEKNKEDFESWRKDVDKVIIKMDLFMGLGRWVLLGFGAYIIMLIWQLITGQAIITFK